MCIGIPGKVILVKNKKVKVKQNSHAHWLDISLISQKLKKGDYLLSYQNTAINKISKKQAKEVLKMLKIPAKQGGLSSEIATSLCSSQ